MATASCAVCGQVFEYVYRGGQHRRWCDAHRVVGRRERDIAYSRAWRAANREYTRVYAKAHYYANKAQYLARNDRRRARKVGATVDVVSRSAVYERDGGRCYLCGVAVADGPGAWHLEHIVPLSCGGRHSWDNLAVSCPRCNLAKGSRGASAVSVGVVAPPSEGLPPTVIRFVAPVEVAA